MEACTPLLVVCLTRKGDLPDMTEEKTTEEKPLEKMTATELREIAKKTPEIKGTSGMKKAELFSAINKARGVKDEVVTKSDGSVRDLKRSIKELKKKRADAIESGDSKNATILKRRISRLKRKTRRSVYKGVPGEKAS
jgi:hypothetical protein